MGGSRWSFPWLDQKVNIAIAGEYNHGGIREVSIGCPGTHPPPTPFWPDLFHQVKLSCRETARCRHPSGTYSSDEDILDYKLGTLTPVLPFVSQSFRFASPILLSPRSTRYYKQTNSCSVFFYFHWSVTIVRLAN